MTIFHIFRLPHIALKLCSPNQVVIICGETGSGKSTQIPQFLYESGYAYDGQLIGITQPRRVATTSTAERVAREMRCLSALESGGKPGKNRRHAGLGVVGYQIRYDASTVNSDTAIKFMTDGILLREITTDLLLRKYSVIILDEAHERNVNTDILLGMVSRALPLRKRESELEFARWNQLSDNEKKGFQV
jgi:ATP-dependent RNA helicase DHX37/DHR1